MKSLRQRRVGLFYVLLNAFAPTLPVWLNSLRLKVRVGLFKSLVRWIELNLPGNRNLTPIELRSRHGGQQNGGPPLVFPGTVTALECFDDVLGRLPCWELGYVGSRFLGANDQSSVTGRAAKRLPPGGDTMRGRWLKRRVRLPAK